MRVGALCAIALAGPSWAAAALSLGGAPEAAPLVPSRSERSSGRIASRGGGDDGDDRTSVLAFLDKLGQIPADEWKESFGDMEHYEPVKALTTQERLDYAKWQREGLTPRKIAEYCVTTGHTYAGLVGPLRRLNYDDAQALKMAEYYQEGLVREEMEKQNDGRRCDWDLASVYERYIHQGLNAYLASGEMKRYLREVAKKN